LNTVAADVDFARTFYQRPDDLKALFAERAIGISIF